MWTTLLWPVAGVVAHLTLKETAVAAVALEVCVPGQDFLSRRERTTRLPLAQVVVVLVPHLLLSAQMALILFSQPSPQQAAVVARQP